MEGAERNSSKRADKRKKKEKKNITNHHMSLFHSIQFSFSIEAPEAAAAAVPRKCAYDNIQFVCVLVRWFLFLILFAIIIKAYHFIPHSTLALPPSPSHSFSSLNEKVTAISVCQTECCFMSELSC